MFFFLSKTLYFAVMPLSLVGLCFLASFFTKGNGWKRRLRVISIAFLVFFTNPFLSNVAMKSWEGTPTPYSEITPHDIGIVLTGITNRYKQPNDRVYMERGADRLLHAIQLYKLGLIQKILISGGSGKLIDNGTDVKEADELKRVAILAEIPSEDILIENKSRNTHESAVNCASYLKENYSNSSIILITSAFHIPRSKACFEKEGVINTPFGTSYYNHDKGYNLDDYIVPKALAIQKWEVLFREWIGIATYWLLGYI